MDDLNVGLRAGTDTPADVNEQRDAAANQQDRLRRITFASFIGTAIEYYDFYIYATAAALVFGTVFFPNESDTAGMFASFATFAVAYLARPLGGIIFGHFGDRVGRKKALVVSLLMMGLGTFLIGLIPSFSSIGAAAAILLVTLRLVQGIGFGGEWGGAVLIAGEHAPPTKRAFYTSWVQMGIPVGFMLSSFAFLLVDVSLSKEQFHSWGWRLPFLISILLVFIGLYVRSTIAETPEFQQAVEKGGRARIPIVEVIREHYLAVLLAAMPAALAGGFFSLTLVYLVRYGTSELGLSASTMMVCNIIANVFFLVGVPMSARLADRVGRYRVCAAGAITIGVWVIPMFALINTAQPVLVTVALSGAMVGQALLNGPLPAVVSEHFTPRVRYTGSSLSYNLSSIFGSALTPLIASWLFVTTGQTWSIGMYVIAMTAVSVLALALLRPSRTARAVTARSYK